MEKEKIIEIVSDVENKPNAQLISAMSVLYEEFEKTKFLILDLLNHLDGIEDSYNKINDEINKRTK